MVRYEVTRTGNFHKQLLSTRLTNSMFVKLRQADENLLVQLREYMRNGTIIWVCLPAREVNHRPMNISAVLIRQSLRINHLLFLLPQKESSTTVTIKPHSGGYMDHDILILTSILLCADLHLVWHGQMQTLSQSSGPVLYWQIFQINLFSIDSTNKIIQHGVNARSCLPSVHFSHCYALARLQLWQ